MEKSLIVHSIGETVVERPHVPLPRVKIEVASIGNNLAMSVRVYVHIHFGSAVLVLEMHPTTCAPLE